MDNVYLKVKKLDINSILPSKRDEDAGYDIYGIFKEDVFLYPGDIYLVSTGISTEFPKNFVFFITERSGSGSKGISTRAGVIDSGYRGEIKTPINNTTNKLIIISDKNEEEIKSKYSEKIKDYSDNFIIYPKNKAIAQGMLLYCPHVEIEESFELGDSVRGDKGFGSSGK